MKVGQFIKKNTNVISAVFVLSLIFSNAVLMLYNKKVLNETVEIQKQSDLVKVNLVRLWGDVVRTLDISVRGYGIVREEKFLAPMSIATTTYKETRKSLDSLLVLQKFDKKEVVKKIYKGIDQFVDDEFEMVDLLKAEDSTGFLNKFQQDLGKSIWDVYSANSAIVNDFEDKTTQQASAKLDLINTITAYFQIFSMIAGTPILILMVLTSLSEKRERRSLFIELEKNNREYLFDPGTDLSITNEEEVIQNSIKNFKQAANFIHQISIGNYKVDWEELNKKNEALNTNNLAGALVQMKQKMTALKSEDEKRNWSTEGLAKFSEVIRNHQHNLNNLCYEVLVFLTKYLQAQQGSFFVLQLDEEGNSYLELSACYAFDKKKHLTKRIEIGQGLVGQTYLEKQPLLLTELPNGYTAITSGLGDETPHCLLVVPMQYNEKVEAVIEIAGFNKFAQHEIEFIQRVGEITASTLGAVKTNERTQKLLEQFQIQTEQLKAQEEELRQNMEEMQATQEAFKREEKLKHS